MLVSILTEQLFSAKGWRVTASMREAERVVVDLEPTRTSAICSGCGETKPRIHDLKPTRTWRHTDCWNMPTLVRAAPRRVRCRRCGIRIERLPWARAKSRFTHAFEADVLRRARDCSISGVCRQLGLQRDAAHRALGRRVRRSSVRKPLRVIGVDEVSYGRGKRKYLTIVWDHARSRVVWIGQGRERDTLDAFFAKLGTRRSRRLRVVTMDMWQGYIGAVKTHAPLAEIVFDRFHIERYLTQAGEEVRRQEFFRRGGAYRAAVRGKKWLLLTKFRRLRRRKRRELMALLDMNRRLFKAYLLKEQFEHA